MTVISLLFVSGLVLPWTVLAASSASANSSPSAVAVGYGSNGNLQNGMIVQLVPKNVSKVEALTANNIDQMYGAVVPATAAPVTLSNNSGNGQVFVATVGRYNVLVSNQNGPIHSGDYITISSLTGIGMKADTTDAVVLGKAAANFDGNTNVEGSAILKTSSGKSISVSISSISVNLDVNHNPLDGPVNGVPGFLRGAANVVTDQSISTMRLYFAFAVFIVAAIVTGSVLYGGVRSSMIAVGRNPLAKSRIMSSLFKVIFSSAVIFIIGLGAVYLVLKV